MASKEIIEKIKESLSEITAVPIASLITNQSEWGALNFEENREDLELIFSLCGQINTLPIDIVPENSANNFLSAIDAARNEVNKIRNFTILGNSNPTQQKFEIISQIKKASESLLIATHAWIPYLAFSNGDVQKNISALNSAVISAQQIIQSAKIDYEAKKIELDGIISAAREASAVVGVAHFTSDFSGKEIELEKNANLWLITTAIFALIVVFVSVCSFFIPLPIDSGNAGLIQFFISKLFLLGILLMATIWCGKIYKGIKHQATRAIFSVGSTGYLDTDGNVDSSLKVMEIFKSSASEIKTN